MSRSNGKQRQRRQFTAEEKATILRRPLVDRIPVSDLYNAYRILPTLFYKVSAGLDRRRGHSRCLTAIRDAMVKMGYGRHRATTARQGRAPPLVGGR